MNEPTALVRLTREAIARLFGLNEGATVDAAFQDAEDIVNDTISFRIRGAGQVTQEGGAHRYFSLSECQPERNDIKAGQAWVWIPGGVAKDYEAARKLLEIRHD